ncbi:MAG: PD40 domain-containing protein [Sandaracinus sp.]|nr:PD40 domain-containing protein [Sandaracinus sp.]
MAFGGVDGRLVLPRWQGGRWLIGSGPRERDGNDVASYSELFFDVGQPPNRRHPFVSADGRTLWHSVEVSESHWDVVAFERAAATDGTLTPAPYDLSELTSTSDEGSPSASADGRWIVFDSNRDGDTALYFALLGGSDRFSAAVAFPWGPAEEPFLFDAVESGECALYYVSEETDALGDVVRRPIVARPSP